MTTVYPAGRIDQKSEQGKVLQQVIQNKLKDFLGPEYSDDVLPLYIVVMLAHGNHADLVADNLEAFLGKACADQFTQWYACRAHLSTRQMVLNPFCSLRITFLVYTGFSHICRNSGMHTLLSIRMATDQLRVLRTVAQQARLKLKTKT